MHDPCTLVCDVFGIMVWHKDPCKDGSDDSCGWFKRARHGNKKVLEAIISRYDFDWDRTFVSDGTGKLYKCGFFGPEGDLVLSVSGITINLIWLAAYEHFGKNRDKASAFCQRNLFDILHFAENPTDSLHDGITQKFGSENREERIKSMASCCYGWVLRAERKWWDHPRYHFWHYQITAWSWVRKAQRLLGITKEETAGMVKES